MSDLCWWPEDKLANVRNDLRGNSIACSVHYLCNQASGMWQRFQSTCLQRGNGIEAYCL